VSDAVRSRREVQRWLSPSNVADDLKKHVEDCLPGSCDWLLTYPYLEGVLTSTSSTFGSIQGPPGAGKSTAAGFLVDHLQSSASAIVLYFFCKASNVEQRQPINVLRTLLSQLLRADEKLYSHVTHIYTHSGRSIADSYAEIEAAFVTTLEITRKSQIFLVIDALDECQRVFELLASLRKCMKVPNSTLRVLVTSRPMELGIVPNHMIRIDDVASTARFIESYISKRVNANANLRGSQLGNRVVSEVTNAADGLWLFARLMMDEIERLASGKMVERQLQTIPHGLTQIYTQIFRTSEEHFSMEQIKFAQQIFLWLDVKDYLPNFLYTGYEGLSFSTLSLILMFANSGEPVFNPIALTREICSPLIKVRDIVLLDYTKRVFFDTDRAVELSQDVELHYVHHSAKQYIVETSTSTSTDLPMVLQPRKFRFFHRAAVAIWYFTDCADSETHLTSLQADNSARWNQSYFDMSYGIWGALKLSELETQVRPEELAELTTLVQKLSDFVRSTKCLRWIETAIIINYSGGFYHLLANAEEALEGTLTADAHEMPIGKDFQKARRRFLECYVYILQLTGWPVPWPTKLEKRTKPIGFDRDSLAQEILKLGHAYSEK
jgi:hypothetical protein